MLRAVIFDLDDTLLSERQWMVSGYAAVARRLEHAYGGLDAMDLPAAMMAAYDADSAHVFDQIAARFEPPGESRRALVSSCISIYRHHQPRLQPVPGAVEMLAWARSRWSVVIATGGYAAAQRAKVAACGLGAHVDGLLFEDDVPPEFTKPHVAWFQRAAAVAGVPATSCAHVGDNPHKDFVAAKQAGMRTVRIRTPSGVYASAPSQAVDVEVTSVPALRGALTLVGSW